MNSTNFREQVVDLVRRVPSGRLVTYGQIARVLGRPRASRHVGGILNALPPDDNQTPWQRVVNSKGGVSYREDPFSNLDPVESQHLLLQAEGLEPRLNGFYSLKEHGMSDSELRATFGTEMLDIVDLENQIVGIAPRSEVRRKNLLHRGVGILCWNSKGELYVHQRTASKDLFPSYYDMMVGGAVTAGEPYDLSAKREVQEELGLGDVAPQFLLEHLYQGEKNYSWIQLYEVVWDGPIHWQAEEICWGQWMNFANVLEWIEQVSIVPDGLEVFKAYMLHRGPEL